MRRLVFVLAMGCGLTLGWSGSNGSSLGGDKKATAPIVRNQYELRTLPYADTYVLLRFERYSGKSWMYTMMRWEEILETTKAVPGTYDIQLVPVGTAINYKDYRAFRIEKDTGLTWMLNAGKWEEMKDR